MKTENLLPMENNYRCIDCNKIVSTKKTKRCRHCNGKIISKKLKNHLVSKDSRQKISITRIISKIAKGKNNPAYKDGITFKKHSCIKCNKAISLNNFYYGKRRCRSCSKTGKNSPRYGKIATHGKGVYYKKFWMRSSWEVAYAKYLDLKNIKWSYESKTFDLGDCTYTPDFYLSDTDEYIEIKGYWRDNSKKKFRLFKEKYKKIKISVLEKVELQNLNVF